MFLPDNHFALLLPSSVFKASRGSFALEIFSFNASGNAAASPAGPPECCHTASFSLPFTGPGHPIFIHPSQSLGAATTLNFSTTACIVAIGWTRRYAVSEVDRVLVTHVRLLTAGSKSHAPLELPRKHAVDEWCEHYSITPITRDTPHIAVVGARLIMTDPINSLGTYLSVYDFNQRRCRYLASADSHPACWPTRRLQSFMSGSGGSHYGTTARLSPDDQLLCRLSKWDAMRILTDSRSRIIATDSILMLVEVSYSPRGPSSLERLSH